MWPKGRARQMIDLTGMKFGRLTVIREIPVKGGKRRFICLCACGNEKEVSFSNLRTGHVKSCGCYSVECRANSAVLTVTYDGVTKTLKQWAKDLGLNYHTIFNRICIKKWPIEKALCAPKNRHKMSSSKIYKVWSSMKHRCSNPNDPAYCNYGARGITVCDEWQTFEPFHTWAMANGYREGLTIERQGNNKGYSPENCIWIPKPEQSNNTRRCRMITYRGETHNIKDWARKLGIPYARLQSRLKHGWEIEEALTLPEIPASLRHANSDEARMIRAVQEQTGIPCRAAQD